MSLITKSYTFSAGATIVAAEHNTNFDTLYNEINGNLDNANIKASAQIANSKLNLATITQNVELQGTNIISGGLTVTGNSTFAGTTIANLGAVTTVDINGGTIDATVIGASSPVGASFSSLSCSNLVASGGTIDGTSIGSTTSASGVFSSLQLLSDTIVNNILDEDDMASDSVSGLATQQSIKAYVVATRPSIEVFTSTDTWTKPSSGTFVMVELWGGGGSGSSVATGGCGGGGGGYAKKIFDIDDLGATETVTVGAGGASVLRTGDNSGNAGGTSSFGSHLYAYGGAGGVNLAGGAYGGGGGGAISAGSGITGGDVGGGNGGNNADGDNASNTDGGGGGAGGQDAHNDGGNAYGGGGGGGGASMTVVGNGGSSVLGGDGGNGSIYQTTAPEAGSVPGGGGGGVVLNGDWNSGAGGAGMCIVYVY